MWKRTISSVSTTTTTVNEYSVALIVRFSPVILGGFGILWLIALPKISLNFAYPFTAFTLALVMLSSRIIFLENIPTLRYFGIILIIVGVLFSSVAKS